MWLEDERRLCQIESSSACFVRRRRQRRDGPDCSPRDAAILAAEKTALSEIAPDSAKSRWAAASSSRAVEIVAASGMLCCFSSGSSSACSRLSWSAPSDAAALRLTILPVDDHERR